MFSGKHVCVCVCVCVRAYVQCSSQYTTAHHWAITPLHDKVLNWSATKNYVNCVYYIYLFSYYYWAVFSPLSCCIVSDFKLILVAHWSPVFSTKRLTVGCWGLLSTIKLFNGNNKCLYSLVSIYNKYAVKFHCFDRVRKFKYNSSRRNISISVEFLIGELLSNEMGHSWRFLQF